jgi:hypothetical protein
LKFIGIGGDKIYFRDSNDNIIAKNNDIWMVTLIP